ncbi:MAG: tetratricopeptide repeat protein [Desulfobacteraceae bacterium]|nr:tetratricopeptide repeat protein [Desulfobacteraceae bacterium]
MKFSHFFTGKPYHEIEKNADALLRIGEYGSAKLEYEKALFKLAKKTSEAPEAKDHIEEKIAKCKDALALEHKKAAENLTETGHYEEAEEILQLALELVQNKQLAVEIEERLRRVKDHFIPHETSGMSPPEEASEEAREFVYQESGEEYFTALISTLPKTEQKIYLGYKDPFREGYVKLNQGYFEDAATLLSQALEANSPSGSFIQLELATAHLNLGNDSEGSFLLKGFLKDYPESLRAYQPLCEIYWQNEQFDKAQQLLLNCPEPLRDSPVIHLLIGETLFRAGQYHDAESHYLDYLDSHGSDEAIAVALAKTFEALGSKEKARKQYSEIINRCQGCGNRIDPLIKQKYADISLETGDHSTNILELYLGLVQEVPENCTDYYQKISMIYELNGNGNEARRFRSFAEQSQHKG